MFLSVYDFNKMLHLIRLTPIKILNTKPNILLGNVFQRKINNKY